MLAGNETVDASPVAAGSASNKMLHLLRKRLRQLSRLALGLAIGLAVAAAAFGIWWLTSLSGLPDIGDPFDVSALRAFSIPDSENAFTLLRQAQQMLSKAPELPRTARASAPTAAWSKSDPKLRDWVQANRAALELFRQGADRADGISRPAGENYSQRYQMVHLGELVWLALLEGSRRQESGDASGAWDCYRSILRATTHLRRRGNLSDRYIAGVSHDFLRQRLASWITDPKTTTTILRKALDESLQSRPSSESDAFSLKLEYLDAMRTLERPTDMVHRALDDDVTYRIGEFQVPTDLAVYIHGALRFIMREPERSRRVLRLVIANWLAHLEENNPRMRKPAFKVSIATWGRGSTVLLYPVGPEAAAGARAVAPEDLAKWLLTTWDLKPFLAGPLDTSLRIRERTQYSDLVISLAGELYRREHGAPPPSEQALVGTFLESLPDDGSSELDDGTTQTLIDSRISAGRKPE
jgi:hypothetical protein